MFRRAAGSRSDSFSTYAPNGDIVLKDAPPLTNSTSRPSFPARQCRQPSISPMPYAMSSAEGYTQSPSKEAFKSLRHPKSSKGRSSSAWLRWRRATRSGKKKKENWWTYGDRRKRMAEERQRRNQGRSSYTRSGGLGLNSTERSRIAYYSMTCLKATGRSESMDIVAELPMATSLHSGLIPDWSQCN